MQRSACESGKYLMMERLNDVSAQELCLTPSLPATARAQAIGAYHVTDEVTLIVGEEVTAEQLLEIKIHS